MCRIYSLTIPSSLEVSYNQLSYVDEGNSVGHSVIVLSFVHVCPNRDKGATSKQIDIVITLTLLLLLILQPYITKEYFSKSSPSLT